MSESQALTFVLLSAGDSGKYPGAMLCNSDRRTLWPPINLGSSDRLSFLITRRATSSDLSNSTWVSIAPIDCMDVRRNRRLLEYLDFACIDQQCRRGSIFRRGFQE